MPKPWAPRKHKNPTVGCNDPKRPSTEQNSDNDAQSELAPLGTSHFQADTPESELSEAHTVLDLRSLYVSSVYWSSHNVPDLEGSVYCKLTMCKTEEVACERTGTFTGHDGPDVTYIAHLYGSIVEKGTIQSREQVVDVLFRTDSYHVCPGTLRTSQMPKHNLTQGLEQQVTINGTYYGKKMLRKGTI